MFPCIQDIYFRIVNRFTYRNIFSVNIINFEASRKCCVFCRPISINNSDSTTCTLHIFNNIFWNNISTYQQPFQSVKTLRSILSNLSEKRRRKPHYRDFFPSNNVGQSFKIKQIRFIRQIESHSIHQRTPYFKCRRIKYDTTCLEKIIILIQMHKIGVDN